MATGDREIREQKYMLTLKAYAKINLFLDVKGKRRDGYHNIKSLLLPVSLHDTIRIQSQPGTISAVIPPACRFPGIPWAFSMGPAGENLVNRAAVLLKKITACRKGARITLTKRIPIGAGLGGGSADAAAVLTGLNLLWKTGLSTKELMEIGARIGCDVPALIHGGAICMEGRGESITPVNALIPGRARAGKRDICMLLVYPGFAISTRDIYCRYEHQLAARDTRPPAPAKFNSALAGLQRDARELIGRGLYNALEQTVFRKYPLLEMIKNNLEKSGAKQVLLTGSGSTVFVLLKERSEGEKAARLIRERIGSPLWTKVVKAIGKRHQSG